MHLLLILFQQDLHELRIQQKTVLLQQVHLSSVVMHLVWAELLVIMVGHEITFLLRPMLVSMAYRVIRLLQIFWKWVRR
jgi:hypothetical protein